MANKGSVFLSYRRVDQSRASTLERQLSEHGFDVWRDESDLYGGVRWPKALGEAIAESNVLLLLWSEAAAESDFVELEWCTALALRVPIVPILLDDTPLPSSLAAMHGLAASRPVADIAQSLARVVGKSHLGHSAGRTSHVMRDLEAGGATDQLVARVRERAEQLNTTAYLALELVRNLVVPVVTAAAVGLLGTAFVLDDPFVLDRNLVMFVALLTLPCIALLGAAALVRGRTARGALVSAAVVVVGACLWYGPRLIAGPVVDVDEPAVAVLFYPEGGGDSVAQLERVAEALPRSMEVLGSKLAIEPFLYDVDPRKDYVQGAIRRNPHIRGVVRVFYRGHDDVRIETQIPVLSGWRRYGIESIDSRRNSGPDGYEYSSVLGIKPGLGLVLSIWTSTTPLNHGLSSGSLLPGVSNWQPRTGDQWSDDGRSTVTTTGEALGEKVLASVARVHGEFMSRVYGTWGADCEAMERIAPSLAGHDGFEWLEAEQELCSREWHEIVQEFAAGRFNETTRQWVSQGLAYSTLTRGLAPEQRRALAAELATPASVLGVASRIFEECGDTDVSQDIAGGGVGISSEEGRSELELGVSEPAPFDADLDAHATAASCLYRTLEGITALEGTSLNAALGERLAHAHALGLIASPFALVERLDLDSDEYCSSEDGALFKVIWSGVLDSAGSDISVFERARQSPCREREEAPAAIALALMLYDEFEAVVESVQHFDEEAHIDAEGRRLLKLAIDRLLAGGRGTATYTTMADEFVGAFNNGGWTAGVEALRPALDELDRDDLRRLLYFAGQGSGGLVAGSALSGLRAIDQLEVAKNPIVMMQLALLARSVAGGPVRDTVENMVDSTLVSKLAGYESYAADLARYYPDLRGLHIPALANNLKDIPEDERVEFLLHELKRGGEPTILKYYLAHTYLEQDRPDAAASTFSELVDLSTEPARKDYYAMRANELGGRTCALVTQQVSRREVTHYDELAAAPNEAMGGPAMSRDTYLSILTDIDPPVTYKNSVDYTETVAALYRQLDPATIARSRSQAPGFLLRWALAHQLRSRYGDSRLGWQHDFGCPELLAEAGGDL